MKEEYVSTASKLDYFNLLFFKGIFTGQLQELHDTSLDRVLERIKEYGTSFTEGAHAIVQALQGHTDSDCKDLAARLNFTRYYSPNKEQQQKS